MIRVKQGKFLRIFRLKKLPLMSNIIYLYCHWCKEGGIKEVLHPLPPRETHPTLSLFLSLWNIINFLYAIYDKNI